MTLRYIERYLRGSENLQDRLIAEKVADILEEREQDVPFPPGVLRPENQPPEISMFSPQAKEALIQDGYEVLILSAKTIRGLRREGRIFRTSWHEDYDELETEPSLFTEVAVNPSTLFMPGSNNKSLAEQESMVREFSTDLSGKYNGVKAEIGGVCDYSELAFQFSEKISEDFFRGNSWARTHTQTPRAGATVAVVGRFTSDENLRIRNWPDNKGESHIFVYPLILPDN